MHPLGRSWVVLLAAAAGAAIGSCSRGGRSAEFGILTRVEVAPLPLPDGLPDPSPVQLTNAFPSLVFDRPLFLCAPPDGSNRIVVVEQPGRVHIFANDGNVTATTVFLDLTAQVVFGGEQGLLGFAFHPDYATNGWFYVYYSAGSPSRTVVSRFAVSANPNVANAGSEQVLLEKPQPFSNHNAGCLQFGPDGKLYIASGDGGAGNDPFENAQSLETLLGKILRLNDDGSVPPDNPFTGTAGARGEIWAYGLRNPWRMSFDASGRLWVGDVGQLSREEVDIVERGGNYGWRLYEGNRENLNPAAVPASAFAAPVIDYDRTQGASVTGGYVYRGAAVPNLAGAYVYADFASGNVWGLVYDGVQAVANTRLASAPGPASFGEDAAGELYICCFDGRIYRFVPAPGGGVITEMPPQLSGTGLFANTAALLPAPGVLEYEVNAEQWSDHGEKRRWIALPGPSRMVFTADDAFTFPIGTALVQHFELATAPAVITRIETRVLLHQIDGWHGYTYRWNAAGSDADLVPDAGASIVLTVSDAGGTRQQTWLLPSRTECLSCHGAAAGRVLGVVARQLNRDFAFPLRVDNQLRTWNHIGLFTTDIGAATSYAAMRDPHDATASVDDRARSYLDSNCATCHRPAGPTPVDLDLRWATAGASMQLFGVAAATPVPGGSGLRAILGNAAGSDLWLRVDRRDLFGMPPLASTLVDEQAVQLLGDWIALGPAR